MRLRLLGSCSAIFTDDEQFVDADDYMAPWLTLQHGTETDKKENFWINVNGGSDRASWKPATNYGKGAWTPENSLVRDTTRKSGYDSLLFTDGQQHFAWTMYQRWTVDGISAGASLML